MGRHRTDRDTFSSEIDSSELGAVRRDNTAVVLLDVPRRALDHPRPEGDVLCLRIHLSVVALALTETSMVVLRSDRVQHGGWH